MSKSFKVGNFVIKKSRRPFKSTRQIEQILEIGINPNDPNRRDCAIFADESVCNLDMLELFEQHKTLKPYSEFYSWVFWLNTHQDLWYAIPTNRITDFFAGKRDGINYFFHASEDVVKNLVLTSKNTN